MGSRFESGIRIVPASGKIYDITHADTNEHSVALPAGYPANTKALIIYPLRIAGTGHFATISVSGMPAAEARRFNNNGEGGMWIRAVDGLFYYRLNVANDDWDIYSNGYITG